jgi:hypothetical protein
MVNSNRKVELNSNIIVMSNGERKIHLKACEEYVHVQFQYDDDTWDGWVPVICRRAGLFIKGEDSDSLYEYLNSVYGQMFPCKYNDWKNEQNSFWNAKRADVTKSFFDVLTKGGWNAGWKCSCAFPSNDNPARRIQDLKDCGYAIATDTDKLCSKCNKRKTHRILLPIPRGVATGYETWSPALRLRILKVLKQWDVYENKKNLHLLPDHKFSEILWDSFVKRSNPDDMTDEEIRQKFQLLSNQRNQQKREICRNCYRTGKRGTIYGIPFFCEGTEDWDESIPKTGKDAEQGCVGCAWYDIAEWRKRLIDVLNQNAE